MNTTSDEMLKTAAQAGDINLLYTTIKKDPHVLENKDLIPFVETPLHIAVSARHVEFAIEIMRLKPSFAWKLNNEGFSPIHLAIQQGQKEMVLCFIQINKELVRVKGREGFTPLHLVSQIGEVDILGEFLFACPESIEDVTIKSETALHIAVRYQQLEALQVLIGWLMTASETEQTILNWKDVTGNTILHLSALTNDLQTVRMLVKTDIDLKVKNVAMSTALDLAGSAEMTSILSNAGAKSGSSIPDDPTRAHQLKSKTTSIIMDKKETFIDKIVNTVASDNIMSPILRIQNDITDDERNAYLVVASLVATATYQSVLSPPGGVYQANAGDNISNTTSTASINSMANATQFAVAGKSVMTEKDFFNFALVNTVAFFASVMTIFILTPIGVVGSALHYPMIWLFIAYLISLREVSPISSHSTTVMLLWSFFIAWGIYYILLIFFSFQNKSIKWIQEYMRKYRHAS